MTNKELNIKENTLNYQNSLCPEITFDAETHTYYINGKLTKSVSCIVNKMDAQTQQMPHIIKAAAKGTYIHDAIAQFLVNFNKYNQIEKKMLPQAEYIRLEKSDLLDDETLVRIKKIVQCLQKNFLFKAVQILGVELQLYYSKNDVPVYAGTIDMLFYVPETKRLWIVDLKTGQGNDAQLYLYQKMVEQKKELFGVEINDVKIAYLFAHQNRTNIESVKPLSENEINVLERKIDAIYTYEKEMGGIYA